MTTAEIHRQILGERNNVVIPKIYIEFVKGDYVAAVVLKEIVWGSGDYSQTAERDGWMYNSEKDWQDHHFLSRKQVNRSITHINTCADASLIDKKVSKRTTPNGDVLNENVTYYRLDNDIYDRIFGSVQGGRFRNVPEGSSGNLPEGKSLTINTGTDTGTDTIAQNNTTDGVKTPTVDDLFQSFWESYPRPKPERHNKKASLAKFKIALKKISFEEIIEALEWWKRTDKWKQDGGQYIDGAQKWLHQEMWEAAKDQPTTVDKVGIGEQQSTDPEEAQREMMRQLEAMRRGA